MKSKKTYSVTFDDVGLCYLYRTPSYPWCEYQLSTNPNKREKFKTKKIALRALKIMYLWREGSKLKVPLQETRWDIIEEV